MKKKKKMKGVSLLLALTLMFSSVSVQSIFAADLGTIEETTIEDTNGATISTIEASTNESSVLEDDGVDKEIVEESAVVTEEGESLETGSEDTNSSESISEAVSNWNIFLEKLSLLEEYANSYVDEHPSENAINLEINYIRTGVERYQSDSWSTIAGTEKTEFVEYVAAQDAANSTTAACLRNLEEFAVPNGNIMDFGHLFGCLNVSSNNSYNQNFVDFGSWLGDVCDLMQCSDYYGVSAIETESLVEEIKDKYFLDRYLDYVVTPGETGGFSENDFRADLDCFYIVTQIQTGETSLSAIFETYYTEQLTDASRAAFFLNNRFGGNTTNDAVRNVIYDTYSAHVLAKTLEADRNLSDKDTLRMACAYVLADYLFELSDGLLVGSTDPEDPDEPVVEEEDDSLYSVFSSTDTTLAPGINQKINYALTADDKQIVYYIATVDVNRSDVSIYANYHDNDPSNGWAMSSVTSQMKAAEARHTDVENYSAIVGVNADFYNMSTGMPSGALVMEGVTYHGVGSENFFAILDDGTPIIGSSSDWNTYKDRIQEAVGGGAMLVKDGESAVTTTSNYYTNRASRTCVGITADDQVVLMVLDGRQEPFSAGGSAEELAQIMLDAGCVIAINLDGGGSTTYAAKAEGSDEISVVNRPSDGYERSVSSSLLVVSTAYTSTEFDHALLKTDTDYLTVGSELNVTLTGVSSTGNAAEIPENAVLRVTDETIGTIDGTTFTALARGTVDVQLVVEDTVVGSKTLTVVRRPDTLTFTKSSINAVYGEATELPLEATYESNPVTINANDITFSFSSAAAGTMEGFSFVGDASSGVRKVTVTAAVKTNALTKASMVVNLYSDDESVFDFDSAMYGSTTLAWNRMVENAITIDNSTYYIVDTTANTPASYTFALDIQAMSAPERLAPLMAYLGGFAGTGGDATPWDYLLALAARVNTQTNVTINLMFDENVDVDTTNLSVVNDYFTLKSAAFDEDTRILSIVCQWNKQDSAIDPDTANSICILNGIVLTPKEDAIVDSSNCVQIAVSGAVSYDIYLRSSQLYALASDESNQSSYGIYPYVDSTDEAGTYGGHFSDQYTTFTDNFAVKQEPLNGWIAVDDQLYYYENSVFVTGIRYVSTYENENEMAYYQFGTDGVCQGKVTGLFELEGNNYYAINGVLKSGWWNLTDADGNSDYYYFDPDTFAGLDGENSSFFTGVTYVFESGKLVEGAWLQDTNGTRYYYGPGFVQGKWYTINGDQYYFDGNGYRYEGYHFIRERDNHEDPLYWYYFDSNGVCQGVYDYTGLFINDGNTYYTIHGLVCNGLYRAEDGYYYYFSSSNFAAVKNATYWVSYPNDTGITNGFYDFDADGRMIIPSSEESSDKNGIVNEDGTLYYYVDGVKTYAGLIQIDDDYYYVNSACTVVTSTRYWVSKTNDLLPATFYTFDADGKMIDAPKTEESSNKNGIVNEDGTLYYYVDGVKTYAGLIQINDDYYYVNSACTVVTSTRYWVSKTNDLLPATFYTFDADGKMVDAPKTEESSDKNGIVNEDGTLYYYVNGVKTYAGLIQIDGDYYYVNSACTVVTNTRYWVSKTNDLLPATFYTFDADGKMITN